MEFPSFGLFPDPVGERSFERSEAACDLCGQSRGWRYACSTYGGLEQPNRLCSWCIADRTAARRGYRFNDATLDPSSVVRSLPPEDVEEVERRTPGFVTWQDHGWYACCGRACRYIGEAKSEDLRGRWAGAVEDLKRQMAESNWTNEEMDENIDAVGTGEACVYVFECMTCSKLQACWDFS